MSRGNYPPPSGLPTSELVLGLARWDTLGGRLEPRLREWLDACAFELDRRVPGLHAAVGLVQHGNAEPLCTCGHIEGEHVAPFRGGDGGRAASGGGNCTRCSCVWFHRAHGSAKDTAQMTGASEVEAAIRVVLAIPDIDCANGGQLVEAVERLRRAYAFAHPPETCGAHIRHDVTPCSLPKGHAGEHSGTGWGG